MKSSKYRKINITYSISHVDLSFGLCFVCLNWGMCGSQEAKNRAMSWVTTGRGQKNLRGSTGSNGELSWEG